MKHLLTLAMSLTLFLSSCGPPFITAKEEGAPFVERRFKFSASDSGNIIRISKEFSSREGMEFKNSRAGSFAVMLERGSLTIFANNSTNPRELYLSAWKRSPEEIASLEERRKVNMFINAIESILPAANNK